MDKFSSQYYDLIEHQLYTAVLADVMDDLGYRRQCLRPSIRPLYPDAKVVGRAATMLAVDVDQQPAAPYALELRLLDELAPGEVVVCTTQGSERAGLWGELLSIHTRAKGSRGVIMDGLVRDATRIIQMRFPVYATGFLPADSKGRLEVIGIREPIEVGGIGVRDGDLVVGDYDGCLVVPREIEDEAVARALEKVAKEDTVRELLSQGASIQAVFKEHGVL
ncbi:MAG: RraA family protein [Anaerolineae bacterium]|nr:RraA family protein [Anaerolineae bacterium]